jgi:D-lactate dehydrogenase
MDLARELAGILPPDRVRTRRIDRIAWASDASVYRLLPRAVVMPATIEEVRALFRFSRTHRVPLTFRAAGTSLSGQAVTDGILVVVSRHWREAEVLDGGRRVRVQPGAIGGAVNRLLRPHGVKLGPDPASIDACMLGGILANNSSGMCCGVEHNAYHTLDSIAFVLPDGFAIDTAEPGGHERLARERPHLAQGLLELKARVAADRTLRETIHRKYRMKNTMGYSLNAFLDHDAPLEILAHLLVGSEGTLAFIAGAVLRTVPDPPLKSTGLLLFPDVPRACAAIRDLRDTGAATLELMDRASLRSIEDQPGIPPSIRDLPPAAAAILVEHQCRDEAELADRLRTCERRLPTLPLLERPTLTRDPDEQAALWRVRKGIIPTIGALRPRGTSCIMEDVVFPLDRLARGVVELQALCGEHGYDDVAIFGHARDGNLHFVLTQAFGDRTEIERYDRFMRALANLVATRHGGALKAEHGTGRNMAPFLVQEWGDAAVQIMRDLKRLVDPDALLNPGVILNDDPRAHVEHLKPLESVEAEVDLCIECGFCERLCPSRELTLTPRQRIVVRREMVRLGARDPADPALAELVADFAYDGLATCATDGLCATGCPVGIDTGKLVKRLRRDARSPVAHELARVVALRFGAAEALARLALRLGRLVRRDLPRTAGPTLPATTRAGARAVYFPACVSRLLGPDDPRESTLPALLVEVAARASLPLWIPEDVAGHCCGLAFSSKGYPAAYLAAVERTVDSLWRWTDGGVLAVVVDASPCAQALKECAVDLRGRARERMQRLRVLDSIEWAHDELLPRRPPRPVAERVVLHPTCSVRRMGLEGRLMRLAAACASRAEVPRSAGCCGFAGDRGFVRPELTAAATREEAAEIAVERHDGYFCTSRTCEIGLTRATGRPFRSLWSLLERATREVG